jgi:hypothetical protein
VQWKKSSIRKVFIISFGHLWVVKLAYNSFKFTFSCQQSDIVPIVNNTGGKFAARVVDTGGNLPPVSLTTVANLPPVSLTSVAKFAAGVVYTTGNSADILKA